MENQELTKYEDLKPLTALEIRANVNLLQDVMKSVMQSGQHYGVIPGAGNKPTLLKPGAEKIMATFRLAPDPEVKDLSANGYIRYQVKCRLLSASGRYLGAGVGEASTDEEKYKWRAVVSEEEWNATPETEKRIKYKKPSQYSKETQVKQIRTNPSDLANTVLKMAKKRALVDGVLTVTAASDIFTQDIEDMPEEILNRQDSEKRPTEKQMVKEQNHNKSKEEYSDKDKPEDLGRPTEETKFMTFLDAMEIQRLRLGDAVFSRILVNNKIKTVEEITDRAIQEKIFKILKNYPSPKDRDHGSEV